MYSTGGLYTNTYEYVRCVGVTQRVTVPVVENVDMRGEKGTRVDVRSKFCP